VTRIARTTRLGAKGRLTRDKVEQCMALLAPDARYDDVGDADLVIEAVFEDMASSEQVFPQSWTRRQAGAILATNTSTLDVERDRAVTSARRTSSACTSSARRT
jgi:3-hydroxyacyl-CoA dehydrogenase